MSYGWNEFIKETRYRTRQNNKKVFGVSVSEKSAALVDVYFDDEGDINRVFIDKVFNLLGNPVEDVSKINRFIDDIKKEGNFRFFIDEKNSSSVYWKLIFYSGGVNYTPIYVEGLSSDDVSERARVSAIRGYKLGR